MIYQEINGPAMTAEQIDLYLGRIGIKEISDPDEEYLRELQLAHITHIPFENIDMMAGRPLSLDREALFRKIVLNGRGGVCSELNTLYNWLLESLGYDVRSYSSRIIAAGSPVQPRSHRVIAAEINGKRYLTDVGFNYEHHRIPLKIEENIVQDDGECRYRLVRDDFFGWLMLQDRPECGWRKKLGFTEDPCIDMDFIPATFYAEHHPDSRINKHLKVSLYIDGVFYAIRSGSFLMEKGGVEEVIKPVTSEEQQNRILRDVFNL
ncbi:MAG: arylamine N-acetyltransferase [Lentihominibacter sp.]